MVDGKVGERPIEWIMEGMKGAQYLCDEGIATALLLADELGKPILAEGPAGVGKTDLAKAYSRFSGLPLCSTSRERNAHRCGCSGVRMPLYL